MYRQTQIHRTLAKHRSSKYWPPASLLKYLSVCPRNQGQSWSHTSRITKDKTSIKNFSKNRIEKKKEKEEKKKGSCKVFRVTSKHIYVLTMLTLKKGNKIVSKNSTDFLELFGQYFLQKHINSTELHIFSQNR